MKALTFILCIVLLFSSNCSCRDTDLSDEYVYKGQDYVHKLPDGYGIARTSAFYANFVRYVNSDGTYYRRDILLEKISIWKYGCSKDERFIFIHYFSDLSIAETPTNFKYKGLYCSYDKEVFYLFDTSKGVGKSFSIYNEFIDFCKTSDIEFTCFYFLSAGESVQEKRIQISENQFFSDRGDYLGQSLFADNKMLFDGFIDEYAILPNGLIGFNLIVADSDFTPEFNDANILLTIDRSQTKGKYFAGSLIMGFNIFYKKYIIYNSIDNSVLEFDTKTDLNKYVKNTFETNIKWNRIEDGSKPLKKTD